METPNDPNPGQAEFSQVPGIARDRLEDPEHISHSIDALMQHLATPEALRSGLDSAMDRQADLYQKSLQLRDRGESLPQREQDELDEINFTLLSLQHLNEKYNPDK